MNYEVFFKGFDDIFAIFGKKMPEDRVILKTYERIKDFPDDFMDFVIKHFEDQETLPRNMGYYLKRILWPEYLEKNPDKKGYEYGCCPLCLIELPGWRRVWGKEKTGWGEDVYVPLEVRCTCGNAKNPRNERIYTDYELIEMGYLLENPVKITKENAPEWLKKIIFCDQNPRKEHVEYTEKYVDPIF